MYMCVSIYYYNIIIVTDVIIIILYRVSSIVITMSGIIARYDVLAAFDI